MFRCVLKKSYTVGKEYNLCRDKPIRIAMSAVKDVSWEESSIGRVSVFGGINKLSLNDCCRDLYDATNVANMNIITMMNIIAILNIIVD